MYVCMHAMRGHDGERSQGKKARTEKDRTEKAMPCFFVQTAWKAYAGKDLRDDICPGLYKPFRIVAFSSGSIVA